MMLRHVQFGYHPSQAVIDDVSAVLSPGRLCALIGPNAAGKSTLLRLMLGLERPWRGSVQVNGHDVAAMPVADRAAQVAYVPQRPATQVAFTVQEVVAMGRYALPADDRAVGEAIEACELQAIRDSVLAELSAGQQQRAALARAMAQVAGGDRGQGRFLLLDEPVSAMDLKHVHATMRMLQTMAKRGIGVLAILHDLNLASTYADDVWLLDRGKLAAAGDWRTALNPQLLTCIYDVPLRIISKGEDGRPTFSTVAASVPATEAPLQSHA